MILKAPAKLNLSLRVVRRREDGFHDIDSVMVRLDGLADEIEIKRAEMDGFTCDAPGVPTDGTNLVVKALNAFREASGINDAVSISLKKKVPHGAGLGGGSSDAAATLDGLNRLLGGGLTRETLSELGAGLGSDVPFFLCDPVMRATGRGEILSAGPIVPSLRVVLLKPKFGVSTPDAYRRWRDSRELEGISYAEQVMTWGGLINELERPVFEKHLFLAEMKSWLSGQPGVSGALMSGSGSTMFAIVEEDADADRLISTAREQLDPTLWAWVGRTEASVVR